MKILSKLFELFSLPIDLHCGGYEAISPIHIFFISAHQAFSLVCTILRSFDKRGDYRVMVMMELKGLLTAHKRCSNFQVKYYLHV